jgi:hypothetical protein
MVANVMFGVPMPNPSPDLTDKVEAALLSQVSEIADQVCDSMLVTSAAVLLKNCDGLGGPRNVVGFIRHTFPSACPLKDTLGRTTPSGKQPSRSFTFLPLQ